MFTVLRNIIREFIYGPIWAFNIFNDRPIYARDVFNVMTLSKLEEHYSAYKTTGVMYHFTYNSSRTSVIKCLEKELEKRYSLMTKEEYHLYKITGMLPEGMK